MKARLFLKSFWQIISIFKIFAFQILSLFFLSYFFGLWAETAGTRGCLPKTEDQGFVFYFVLVIGIVLAVAALRPILFPHIWLEEISKEFSGLHQSFRFPFFSTHPSYISLDVLLFIPAIILFWNGNSESLCKYNFYWGQGFSALIIALAFPTLRLIFWYVLGKQIYAMQSQNILVGIIWWYILALPIAIFFSYIYIHNDILPRLNTPIVNSETFQGGLAAHPEFTDKIIRVRGTIKQGIAKCGLWGKIDRTDYPYGTIVVDMGEGNGEIMVQAKKHSDVQMLESEAQKDGIFETFGRLSKLPNPEKKMLCGISNLDDELPPGGRTLLEIEFPK